MDLKESKSHTLESDRVSTPREEVREHLREIVDSESQLQSTFAPSPELNPGPKVSVKRVNFGFGEAGSPDEKYRTMKSPETSTSPVPSLSDDPALTQGQFSNIIVRDRVSASPLECQPPQNFEIDCTDMSQARSRSGEEDAPFKDKKRPAQKLSKIQLLRKQTVL